jgi:uncharacterized protein YjbI with pentapeptide repeats
MNINIQSKRFQVQNLQLNFRNARAGHSPSWKIILLIIGTVSTFSSFLLAFLAATCLATSYLSSGNVPTHFIGIALFIYITILVLIPSYGFSIIYISPVFVGILYSILSTSLEFGEANLSVFFLMYSLGLFFTLFGVTAVAQCLTYTYLSCSLRESILVFLASFLAVSELVMISSINTAQNIATNTAQNIDQEEINKQFFIITALLFSIALTGLAVSQRALKSSQRFTWIRKVAVFWSAMGGTSFKEADLSNLDFTGSILANTDLRSKKLYRTCFRSVKGLDRARVNNNYLDLDNPRVQNLLINGCSDDTDFSGLNLQGAYLQGANLQNLQLIETNLNGADLQGTDLRNSILVRAIVTGVDFTGADLTGACIEDWSFNSETRFEGVTCDYIYREYENDRPTDRYPPDRNFEPGEFQSLFQKLTNAVELVFKDQVDWRALSFTFEKFRVEDDGLELELKGVEQRGDYWIVKVTHKEGIPRQEVEQKVIATYDDIRLLLESKDQEINRLVGINTQLMGIMENQTSTLQNQSEALRNYSEKPFGNSFVITGSTITNLAGSGQIEYAEAANQVRSIVAQGRDPVQMTQKLQQLLGQFQQQSVATTPEQQAELLRQLILSEAESDEIFKGFLKQQGQQILQGIPTGAIASAIYSAIEQLK